MKNKSPLTRTILAMAFLLGWFGWGIYQTSSSLIGQMGEGREVWGLLAYAMGFGYFLSVGIYKYLEPHLRGR